MDSGEVVTAANAAIDAKVTKAYIQGFDFLDSAEVVTAADGAIDAKVTLSYGKNLGFLDSAEVVQAAKDAVNKTYIQAFDFLDSAEVVTAANAAIDVKVDSDFIRALGSLDSTDLVPYVTLTGTQTVSNKTLTDPKIGASTQLYGQTYGGLSVNKDQTYGDSTETHLSIFSGDSSRDAALLIGVDNRTSHAIGNVQDRINNTNDLFIAVGDNASSIKFTRRALEGSVVNWTGVTPTDDLLMRIDNDGKIHVPKDTNATTRTAAAFTIAGGLGVDKDIRALDIYASNDLRAQGSIIGDVTGTVSSLSNHNTNNLSEGDSNLYYTTVRFDSDFGTKTTDNLTEGSTNLYYDSARTRTNARNSVSVNDAGGDGSLTYNASTGVLTYTGPSASDTRAHFTAGTGVTISNGEISIGQSVSTTDSVDFAGGTFTGNVSITGNLDVQGTQTINAYNDLRVTQPLIKVGDSNNTDTFDLGLVGRYSDDGGSTIRRAGFVRDATNGEWYVFSNLIQDGLDSSDPDKTIDFSHSSLELPIWNFGGLRGQYLGFDSDFQAFSTNYTLYTSSFTAVSAGRYALNSSGGSFNVTLPASPSSGDYVRLIDVGNFTDNSVTVLRNGSTIEGGTEDFELDIGQNIIEFLFINNTWNVYASIGQRGETGPTGPAADSADFVSPSKAIAFAIALG
jgi:hypothetical protein